MGERFLDTEEAGGSIPPVPTKTSSPSAAHERGSASRREPDGEAVEVPAAAPPLAKRCVRSGSVASASAIAARRRRSRSSISSRPLDRTPSSRAVFPESRDGLEVIRHSTAHLMAHAVKRLFPETQVTIGPVDRERLLLRLQARRPFTPEDLERIEGRCARSRARTCRSRVARLAEDEAIALFRDMGEQYKVEIIEGIPDERASRSTARAISSISVAARTCRRPAGSRRSS